MYLRYMCSSQWNLLARALRFGPALSAAHHACTRLPGLALFHQVRSLARRLAAVESKLQSAVLDDFKILIGGPANDGLKMPPENLERLATACLVVDALGPKVGGRRAKGNAWEGAG